MCIDQYFSDHGRNCLPTSICQHRHIVAKGAIVAVPLRQEMHLGRKHYDLTEASVRVAKTNRYNGAT